jgi:hypothetical protein
MCTPSDDNLLLVGTIVGSINLYDLKDFEMSSYRSDELDYIALLRTLNPNSDGSDLDGETN